MLELEPEDNVGSLNMQATGDIAFNNDNSSAGCIIWKSMYCYGIEWHCVGSIFGRIVLESVMTHC